MSIAVIIGVHDGVVLAADSASTLTVGVPQQPGSQPAVGVLNVYDNANKIFNLYKGKPIGCITFGSGRIGNASIATLVKDLRFKLTKGDVKLTNDVIKFDPSHYAIVQVAEILARFLDEECAKVSDAAERKGALSENLTKRPLLRNFLHPLNCEEPTLVTVIRLAMDERHRSGWFERDAEGAGLRLNWAGHGERLDEGVGIPWLSGLSAGDRRRAPAAQVVDQAQAGESQHDLCGLRKTGAQDARGV